MRVSVAQLSEEMINAMSPKDRKDLKVKTVEERSEAANKVGEAAIQRMVESYLIQLGYERRTTDNILGRVPASGWFIHYNPTKTKGNPIILDLLILGNDGQYMELELKTEKGNVKPHQQILIEHGAFIARGAKEALGIINAWHTNRLNKE